MSLLMRKRRHALKKSLSQLTGSLSYWLATLEKELLKALALSEASFEFLDEEMEFAPQISGLISTVQLKIDELKISFCQQDQIRNGIKIAIIGAVNAGKSSLFNAILKQERAIVTPIAGTTRDSIEAGIHRNGNFWTLIDTAGLRQTDDVIEQEGIRRSFEQAAKADIIILAQDSGQELTPGQEAVYKKLEKDYAAKIIYVLTKVDEIARQNERECASRRIPLSSKTNYNLHLLERAIEQKIASLFAGIESPFLLNQRQFNLLLALESKLIEIQGMLHSNNVAYELLSIHLTDAIAALSELTGKAISEAGMDTIFREFCIGK